MIVDPWGFIVAQCRYGAACMTSPRISDTCAATCRHLRLRLDWPILYVHNRPHSTPLLGTRLGQQGAPGYAPLGAAS